MKDRRPRKLKKILKRRFQSAINFKTMQCALLTVGSAFQVASIQSRPIPKFHEGSLMPEEMRRKSRAIQVAQLAIETAQSISEIMNSGPKNWREA